MVLLEPSSPTRSKGQALGYTDSPSPPLSLSCTTLALQLSPPSTRLPKEASELQVEAVWREGVEGSDSSLCRLGKGHQPRVGASVDSRVVPARTPTKG
jgi:hypothetical protein